MDLETVLVTTVFLPFWNRVRTSAPLLHQYTDSAGLKGIVESGKLRGTNILFMNDGSESRYASNLIRMGIDDMLLRCQNPVIRPLLGETLKRWVARPQAPVYAFCLTERGDQLSQWRAYGGDRFGYSIGLKLSKWNLNPPDVLTGWQLRLNKVWYSRRRQTKLISSLVEDWSARVAMIASETSGNGLARAELDTAISTLLFSLTGLAEAFKDPSFEEEHEWRLTFSRFGSVRSRGHRGPHPSFSVRPIGLTPWIYLPLQLPSTSSPLPIIVVRHGPGGHPDISKMGLRQFLTVNGYARARVAGSTSPLRV